MSTGVVIRLKNLQLDAGTIDIRRFFGGLQIPDGGVHIIGGSDGTAFILFSTDEDARRAMLLSDRNLCGAPVKLLLSSHTEMKNVIEESQRAHAQLRGLRLPEPPITNLSTRSSAAGFQPKSDPKQNHRASDVYLQIKEMPFDATDKDVIYFFNGLNVLAIRFVFDEKGRKTGTAFVKFKTPMDKFEGLKKDLAYIGKRFVRITSATERQWLSEGAQNGDRPTKRHAISPREGTPKRSREFSPLRTDNCVELRGLPTSTAYQDVMGFFSRQSYVQDGLFLEMDGHTCKGRAFVEFKTYTYYKEALQKDGDMLLGKQVRVINISKPNMLDQIKIHNKYVQGKREEEFSREREKKKQREESQEHRKRKQREMDEWLRRQHVKEEEDRKRLDLEKRRLAQAIEDKKKLELKEQLEEKLRLEAREKARLEEQRKIELEEARLDELEKQLAMKSELKKKIEQEERQKMLEFKTDFPGAEEMDIVENSPVRSPVKLEVVDTKAVTFPAPVFGSSGAIVTPFPPFNSHQPPPFLPPTLPPVLPRGLVLTTTPGNNLPPLPPVLPPPPIPSLETTPKPDKPETLKENSEFVRVSNSFFHVTEPDIRNFFSGLKIRDRGVQFILKQGNVRTGYIFIHFATCEDAKKSTSRRNQKLSGRPLTVQLTTPSEMADYIKEKYNVFFFPLLPPGGDYFTSHIGAKNLTCVRVGYLPYSATTRDVVASMRNPDCTEFNTTVLASGDTAVAYIEFGSTSKCVEVTNRGPIPILGQLRGVTPLSSTEMIRSIEDHDRNSIKANPRRPPPPKIPPPEPNREPFLNKFPPRPLNLPPHPLDLPPPPRRYSPVMLRDMPPMDRSRPPPPFPPLRPHLPELRPLPPAPIEILPLFDHHTPPPPFPPKHPIILPKDLSRLPPDPIFRGLPPSSLPPPRFPGRPPLNPHLITTLKMSNLSFKITREDILEFFGYFDPLLDSVRLMYDHKGRLTGDGIISFPNREAASAAFNQKKNKPLLQRPVKLFMQ